MMRLLLILLISLSIACKAKKEINEKKEPLTESKLEQVDAKLTPVEAKEVKNAEANSKNNFDFPSNAVARIQRTACFGRCPIYTLTVFEDGKVLYEAVNWVDEIGTFVAQTDGEKFRQLLEKAEQINYFELENKYDSEYVTDLPSTITTLRRDDLLKQVVNRYQGPEQLSEFEKYFDSLYLELQWSKQDDE